MTSTRRIQLVSLLSTMACASAFAQTSPIIKAEDQLAVSASPVDPYALSSDYVVTSIHIDNVRDQHNIFEVAQACSNSPACAAILSAGSAYFGIPLDKAVAVAAVLAGTRQGEGTYFNINLPSGYVYCKSDMRMTSIVPHDGPRGSLFLARADAASLYVETWTPVLPFGQGRSWVEANVTVVGVAASRATSKYSDGTCHKPDSRVLFYCRGGGCVDTVDSGQSVPASSPPGAGSRN